MTCGRNLFLGSCICLIAFSVGCSNEPANPPTYGVSGKVTYKNEPVEGATVVLVPEVAEGQGAVGSTDANGNYQLGTFEEGDGAVAGKYKVRVFKYEIVAEPAIEMGDMTEEDEEDAYTDDDIEEDAGAGNLLPAQYENAYKSGFEVEVIDTAVTLDMDLK